MAGTYRIDLHPYDGTSGYGPGSTIGNRVTFDKRVILRSIWYAASGYVASYQDGRVVWVYEDATRNPIGTGTGAALGMNAGDWQEVILDEPVILEAGTVYMTTIYHPTGSGYPTASSKGLTNPHAHGSTPAMVNATVVDMRYTSANGFPTQLQSGEEAVLRYGVDLANVAPNAPTLTAPADGTTLDRATGQTFTWAFSDPDAGDSQSAYSLRYRPVGTATWTTTGWQASPTSSHTFAGGTFAAGDYEWQVATKDAQGVAGPFSSSLYFTAATAPPAPTITDPANGATIPTDSQEFTWSTPDQDAYQLQVLDGPTVLDDTGEVGSATARSYTVSFPTNNVSRTVQVRIKDGGLWSPWSAVTVSVSYTAPAAPIVSVVELDADAALRVDVLNPAPVGDEPTVSYNDVDVDDGNGWERRAAQVTPNGSWTYWTPISGRDYTGRVRVKAVGDNGTSTTVVVP